MLKLGTRAPDFEVLLPHDRTITHSDYQDRSLLLIFLRHLA